MDGLFYVNLHPVRKVKLRRSIAWAVLVIVIIISIVFGFDHFVPEPPTNEIELAQKALADARRQKAEIYSHDLYNEASIWLDSAMTLWKIENSRFALSRNYDAVVTLARLSVEMSNESVSQTRTEAASLEKRTKIKLSELNQSLDEINTVFHRFPLQKKTRKEITRGKLLLNEGVVAMKKSDFVRADKKFREAEALINAAHEKALRLIKDYFKDHKKWISLMDQTIAESKKKRTTVVIVDKFASRCYVYKNGKKTKEFDAELGKNWVGDKRHKGDHATPEGRYRVTKKKEGRETKYYKALLIDYPNDDDRQRFNRAIANGNLPANSKIGGLIEIHGHGGKGTDWTEGCVALANSDMDILYNMVSLGTEITIVGSVQNLDSILKK
jgi:murein L,D-transpeptidase YafK